MKRLGILLVLVLAGCQSWPKDSYIKNAESVVNTPWGPSTLKASVVATGAAAKNLTAEDKAPEPKKPATP